MARRAKSTITKLNATDMRALQKIEDDADSISKEKLSLYNAYRGELADYSVNYLRSHIEIMFDMIDYDNIDTGKGKYDHTVYNGTPFIEHELRDVSCTIKNKSSTKAKDFFMKPLGIFNVTEFEETDVYSSVMLNIVGATLVDDGVNYLCDFPYMPYLFVSSGDVGGVHTKYMLVPLSRAVSLSDVSSFIKAVDEMYKKYLENVKKIELKVEKYTANRAVEKYPSSW